MIKIAIVDDEKFWLNRIESQLEQLLEDETTIRLFSSAAEFQADGNRYNAVFFDVELGDYSAADGLELCRLYKQQYPQQDAFAIILTCHTELGRRGYLSNAFRYIDKGNLENELQEATTSMQNIWNERMYIELPLQKVGTLQIKINSIICVETERRKISVRMQSGECYYLNGTFIETAKLLEPHGFYIIRKGVTINMRYVAELKNDAILLKDIIPQKWYYISRRKCSDFVQKYTEWRIERASG